MRTGEKPVTMLMPDLRSPDEVDPTQVEVAVGTGAARRLPVVPSTVPDAKVVRALFDYDTQTEEDLAFRKGDRMILISDKINQDWWYAKSIRTSEVGYIPRNFVVEDDDSSLKSQEWFFEIDRREADKLLMLPGNAKGTFLVRGSADLESYALSIRDYDSSMNDFTVKHYKIRKLDDGGCYISAKRTFPHIFGLVAHYREFNDGLCSRLEFTCPRTRPVIAFRELEINRSGIRLIKKLGAGNFGEVWSGKWRSVDVAVKMLKAGKMTMDEFMAEARVMHKLQHKHLVQLMAVCTDQEPMYIITELMSKGALLDYLREDAGKALGLKILLDMATQVCSGMAYLEKENFVHRDLRAANILVSDNNLVKVADFGLARAIHSEEKEGDGDDDVYEAKEGAKFPIKWTAPEAAFERKFSIKSDVWSFGVLLWEMCTYGKQPYPGMSARDTLDMIERGYRMPKPTHEKLVAPDSLYKVMTDCWDKKPENRPTFEYLYGFFDDYFVSTEPNYDPIK